MKISSRGNEAPALSRLPSRLLGRTALLVGRFVGEVLTRSGAHRHHFAVLATLEAFGPASQAELCRRTDLDRSDMNASINALESEGSVRRAVDPTNRRQNVVALTDAGRTRFNDLLNHLEAAQSEAFAPLSMNERAELMRLLRRVHDHLASEPTTAVGESSNTKRLPPPQE